MWQKDLEEKSKKLNEALRNKNENILKELSGIRTKKPSDLNLSKYQYEKNARMAFTTMDFWCPILL